MNRFEEAIQIILEYCVNKEIAIHEIFKYLDLEQTSIYLVIEGKQQQLINYLVSFHELNNICRIMEIEKINFKLKYKDPQRRVEYLFKKAKLFYKLRDLLKLQNQKSETQLDLSFWVNQFTNYYVQQLNFIAHQSISFPEILYCLSITINNNEIQFTIEPNKFLRKSLKEALAKLETTFRPYYMYMKYDEIKILEKMIKNIKSNYSLKISRENTVLNLLDNVKHLQNLNYKNNQLLSQLITLKNKILKKAQSLNRLPQQKNILIIMIYLKEYLVIQQACPNILKYLQMQKHSYKNLRKLEINGKEEFIEELQQFNDPKIQSLNKINWDEIPYESLHNRYPYETVKQQQIMIDKTLTFILEKADSLHDQLKLLFSHPQVALLVQTVKQLGMHKDPIYSIIIKLHIKIEGNTIPNVMPQDSNHISHQQYQIKTSQLYTNLRVLLRMMIDKNIIIPELIQFIKIYQNDNALYQICMTKSLEMLHFLENDARIINLMDVYDIPISAGKYRILNFLPQQVKLVNKLYEFQGILNRIEAIDQEKQKHRKILTIIFQQLIVKQLLTKLQSLIYIQSTQIVDGNQIIFRELNYELQDYNKQNRINHFFL